MREVNETVTKTPGSYSRRVLAFNQTDLFSALHSETIFSIYISESVGPQ